MNDSTIDPDSAEPYTEDEWSDLLDALFAAPVDASTLRTLLGEALGTLAVLATGDKPRKIVARRLRRTRVTIEQVNQREGAV